MPTIFRRLSGIARSYLSQGTDGFGRRKKSQAFPGDFKDDSPSFEDDFTHSTDSGPKAHNNEDTSGSDYDNTRIPKQVIEDLKIFGLNPPSSIKEVKKARNREIKKYHSDNFLNNPERLKTSKEIMQIYNGAYERLSQYYAHKYP